MTTPCDGLFMLLRQHERTGYALHGAKLNPIFTCRCGDISSDHDKHLSDAIIAAGWTPPIPATLDTATTN